MSPYKIALFLFLFVIQLNLIGQTKSYPFEIQKSGNGNQAILFIPGFACSADVWKETKSKLEHDFTCYTLTMAGFAGIKPMDNSSFKNWAMAIVEYIKDNKIEKPIVVGHSMGGGLALSIASTYPHLLDRIIVVDALPCLSALMNPTFQSKENNDCSAMVNQMTSVSDEQFYLMQKMSIPRLVADTTMQATIINWSMKSDRKTMAAMYCDFLNTDLRENIKTIEVPTLVLLESYFVNLKPAIESQYKNLKQAKLEYATKGLHFIMYDDKEWYFKQVMNFMTEK